jgi:hypothetical protein
VLKREVIIGKFNWPLAYVTVVSAKSLTVGEPVILRDLPSGTERDGVVIQTYPGRHVYRIEVRDEFYDTMPGYYFRLVCDWMQRKGKWETNCDMELDDEYVYELLKHENHCPWCNRLTELGPREGWLR